MGIKKIMVQTEIGMLPEDWEVKRLRDLVVKYRLGGNYKTTLIPNDFPLIKMGNIGRGSINVDKIEYINTQPNDDDILIYGDILFNTRNTLELVGKVAIWKNELPLAYYNSNLLKIYFDKKYIAKNQFINSIFNHKLVLKQLSDIATGTTSVAAIYTNDLLEIYIPVPPLAEQEKIAEALSDADAWIESLEQLLAKKRLIKQGAMQKLLTPKEGWEEKKLGEVAWFQEGPGLRNWQFKKNGIKVINVTNLENGYLNLSRTERHISYDEFNSMYRHFEIDENDIVIASSGNSYGKVAVVRKQDLPLVMNTSVIRFKPINGISYQFLLIFLKSPLFKKQIDLLITGGAQPNFGPAHLNKILIHFPKKTEEQNRIATILSDMDSEIEALEAQLAKARQLKQGMMQVLLTGKVRL